MNSYYKYVCKSCKHVSMFLKVDRCKHCGSKFVRLTDKSDDESKIIKGLKDEDN